MLLMKLTQVNTDTWKIQTLHTHTMHSYGNHLTQFEATLLEEADGHFHTVISGGLSRSNVNISKAISS